MITDMRRWQNAHAQGIKDAEAGIEHRLEICHDEKEYQFYIQGRLSVKTRPTPTTKNCEEPSLEPLRLDL
jgi:hypothetical protein